MDFDSVDGGVWRKKPDPCTYLVTYICCGDLNTLHTMHGCGLVYEAEIFNHTKVTSLHIYFRGTLTKSYAFCPVCGRKALDAKAIRLLECLKENPE